MLSFRPLTTDDQGLLWHWLHVALWDPPPGGQRPLEVLQAPGVRISAEAWGEPTDVGVVALVDGQLAGACWMRLLPLGVCLVSVDSQTTQLGIALEPAHQHQGHGQPLMTARGARGRLPAGFVDGAFAEPGAARVPALRLPDDRRAGSLPASACTPACRHRQRRPEQLR